MLVEWLFVGGAARRGIERGLCYKKYCRWVRSSGLSLGWLLQKLLLFRY